MNRRGFLQTCLALAAAPAIVRADSLMRVIPRETKLLTLEDALGPYRPIINVAAQAKFITNFAQLTEAQKKIWAAAVWNAAREDMFLTRFSTPAPQALVSLEAHTCQLPLA